MRCKCVQVVKICQKTCIFFTVWYYETVITVLSQLIQLMDAVIQQLQIIYWVISLLLVKDKKEKGERYVYT